MLNDSVSIGFAVFGAFIGVLFVVDGWRGSSKNKDFKDSPRIRALLWVVGAAVGSFFIDLKKFGVQLPQDSSEVFAAYFLGFIFAVVFVLLTSVLVFLVQNIWNKAHHRRTFAESADLPFLPIMDYIHYGYSQFKESRAAGLAEHVSGDTARYRKYLIDYADELATAVSSVNYFRATSGATSSVAKPILRSITRLTQDLHRVSKINVNYMRAYPYRRCSEEMKSSLRFAFGNPAHYSHILVLAETASNIDREGFSLPVEPVRSSGPERQPAARRAVCIHDEYHGLYRRHGGNRVPQGDERHGREGIEELFP